MERIKENIMEVKGLSFAYPGKSRTLHNVDLHVRPGEFVLMCGASGSGKTTLLRCMKPQIAPVGEKNGTITELPAGEVGFVFQNPDSQIVTDTVRHELAFGLENLGLKTDTIRRRVAETALFFGIDGWLDAQVHEISGGQKQFLNLASVIAMRPKLLLLDEPVSQLDPSARKTFLELLVRVNRELGIAVFISGHNLDQLLGVCDRVVSLREGRAFCGGTAAEYARYLLKEVPGLAVSLPASVLAARAVEVQTGREVTELPLDVRGGRALLEEYQRWLFAKASDEAWKDAGRMMETFRIRESQKPVEVLLQVDHIWFRYQKQLPFVLKGADLEIRKGEIHAVLGGNGSGKTTLLQILGKRLSADRGKIRLKQRGQELTAGLLLQNPKSMFSRDTVEEELAAAGCLEGLAARLSLTGLSNCHPYDLSGGEQQRLGFAMVISKDPRLLLLDEPTKGLDVFFKEEIASYLTEYAAKGNAVLLSTHDVEFAAKYADVCSFISGGEVLVTEPARTFFEDNAFYTTDMVRILRGFGEGI